MAGGPGLAALPDQHDRRRHQPPASYPVRAPRFDRREHAAVVELRGAARPVSYYTDKASLFQTAPKISRDSKALPVEEREPLPPTQIGRALRELDIVWIGAHSPQAKGRVERSFQTAQDRLVKGLRVAGTKTLEQANAYMETAFLVWWNQTLAVVPASPDNDCRAAVRL